MEKDRWEIVNESLIQGCTEVPQKLAMIFKRVSAASSTL